MKTTARYQIILVSIGLILLIPFVAMQFTSEVSWSASDFAIMAFLLLSTGTLVELAIQQIRVNIYRFILVALIIMAFLLLYIEMAVGLFGSPIAGS